MATILSSSLGHPKFQKFGIVLAGFAAQCWARRVVILLIQDGHQGVPSICCLQKFHRPMDSHPRSPTDPARSVGADVCRLLRNPFCVTRQALLSRSKAGSPNFKEKTSQSLFISWFFLKPQKTEELRKESTLFPQNFVKDNSKTIAR